jgi:hypothetical protein
MNKVGINTKKYKAYYIRMVAISKVLNISFTVDDVMKQECWRFREIFEKFITGQRLKILVQYY